jgi:alcohol dehydrogenase class IV
VETCNKQVVPERFADIARAMGKNIEGLTQEEAADRAIEAIKKLAADIAILSGLRELGAREETSNFWLKMPCRTSADSQIQETSQKKKLSRFTEKQCMVLFS